MVSQCVCSSVIMTSGISFFLLVQALILCMCNSRSAGVAYDTDVNPIVVTDKGPVRGQLRTSLSGKTYYAFQGIPYAKPPVAELRFQPPVDTDIWTEPLNVTEEGSACTQPSLEQTTNEILGDEDCLFLNIFTPKLFPISPYPVIIWIHGGSFNVGSGDTSIIDGPEFLLEKSVVFVSFNYRLGPFGFLNLPSANISGNAGLKDQLAVLRWVNRNVNNFGGDKNRVTLLGWSAGSASVNFHLLSNNSAGLFHGAILMSGVALNPWAFSTQGVYWSEKLSSLLGVDVNNNIEMAGKIRNATQRELIQFATSSTINNVIDYEHSRGLSYLFVPSFLKRDDDFMNEPHSGQVANVPVIIGRTSFEGLGLYSMFNDPYWSLPDVIMRTIQSYYMTYDMNFTKYSSDEIASMIAQRYFQNRSESIIMGSITLDSDFGLFYGIHKTVKMHMKRLDNPEGKIQNWYYYKFSFDGDFAYYKQTYEVPSIDGVCHGDDFGYLFKYKKYEHLYNTTTRNTLMLKRMVSMWTNFVHTGDPTPDVSDIAHTKWPPVSNNVTYYMDINDDFTVRTDIDNDVYDFWNQFYD